MRGTAANHGAEGNNGLEALAGREALCRNRHFIGPRHAYNLQVTLFRTMTLQGIDGARQQALHHETVEARDQQRDTRITQHQLAFLNRYLSHFSNPYQNSLHYAL